MTALAIAIRLLLLAWTVAALLSTTVEARFFPIEALKPGLRGTGKTVVRGTEVESFEVEYLGVVPQAGPAGDLILVRVSGDVIERTGGIAAGMSGSPVYIDDQLVGAIGYGYDFADHRIGLVTPIGDMLQVMDRMKPGPPRDPALEGVQQVRADGPPATGGLPRAAVLARDLAEAEALAKVMPEDVRVFVPVQTPVLTSGLSARALNRLKQRLPQLNLIPVQAGVVGPEMAGAKLEPGSAFAVQLVRGDVSLTAIGTVTYVEGDGRFVGFGHPFINQGVTDFLATTAYIHTVVPALSVPFKLGSPGVPVGSLLQDRGAAVGGVLGRLPYMVPVTITIRDRDLGTEVTRQFSVVHDQGLLTSLVVTGALGVLDRTLDRLGPGTSRVVFQIRGEGLPRPLVRDNIYYSEFDVAGVSLIELLEAVDLVVNNRFTPVTLTRVQIVADIEQARRTAHIESAQPSTTQVLPGESVRVSVRLRPYRAEAITEELILTVPPDASPGPVTVVVRGGGWGLEPPLAEEDRLEETDELLEENVQDLERLIEEFVRRERNHEIVAEFYSSTDTWPQEPNAGDAAGEGDGAPGRGSAGESEEEFPSEERPGEWYDGFEPTERVVASVPTDYVILGSTSFELYILPDYRRDAWDGEPTGATEEIEDVDAMEEAEETGASEEGEEPPAAEGAQDETAPAPGAPGGEPGGETGEAASGLEGEEGAAEPGGPGGDQAGDAGDGGASAEGGDGPSEGPEAGKPGAGGIGPEGPLPEVSEPDRQAPGPGRRPGGWRDAGTGRPPA
ncbi:MAG TPA: SpoIVB peptidase S55 domain-containing protein [Limnochordales bacterium]